jgi:hypothetical protein
MEVTIGFGAILLATTNAALHCIGETHDLYQGASLDASHATGPDAALAAVKLTPILSGTFSRLSQLIDYPFQTCLCLKWSLL